VGEFNKKLAYISAQEFNDKDTDNAKPYSIGLLIGIMERITGYLLPEHLLNQH
jgi:hypothetical protein